MPLCHLDWIWHRHWLKWDWKMHRLTEPLQRTTLKVQLWSQIQNIFHRWLPFKSKSKSKNDETLEKKKWNRWLITKLRNSSIWSRYRNFKNQGVLFNTRVRAQRFKARWLSGDVGLTPAWWRQTGTANANLSGTHTKGAQHILLSFLPA